LAITTETQRKQAVERMRRWRLANPEKAKEAMRRWRARNPDKSREATRRWYAENREKARENLLKYRVTNRAVIAASHHLGGKITPESRAFAERQILGCAYCGSNSRLQVDHKVPKSRGGRDHISNLQWLCRQCNHAKFDMTEDEFFAYIKKLALIRAQYEDSVALAAK